MFLIVFVFSTISLLGLEDTLQFDNFTFIAKEDINYYKLQIKNYKNNAVQYYLGFDKKIFLSKEKSKDYSSKQISFYENDSLICSLDLSSDTNFVVLVSSLNQPVGADTIRIFEQRESKKINPEEIFIGFKKIQPIKITIVGISNTLTKNKFEKTVFLFKNKKLITYFKASKMHLKNKHWD